MAQLLYIADQLTVSPKVMNHYTRKRLYSIFIGIFFILINIGQSLYSQTYTSIATGNWTNTTNVWSLDGITPCGCAPPNPTAGVDIEVFHDMNLGVDLDITGGSNVSINYNYFLDGSGSTITVDDGFLHINGDTDIQGLDILTNGTVTIQGYVSVFTSNSMNIYGVLNLDGGYLDANSSIDVQPGGTLIVDNYSKISSNASFSNKGFIYICDECCVEISGSVTNYASGSIVGSGAWNTVSGTTKNFGYWDPTMFWCSAGNDTGMPSAEDCTNAEGICDIIVLAVDLTKFEGILHGNIVELNWTTESEYDNDYFIIERTDENLEFNNIGYVNGAGNSTSTINYSFQDKLYKDGIYHYRIKQVDFNGEYEHSEIVSIKYANQKSELIGTYNLLGEEVDDSYSGVVIYRFKNGDTERRYQP